MSGLTYFVTDKKGKEVGISGKEYWDRVKAKEAAKPKRKPTKTVERDPIVRKFEYINGKLTERGVKQSVLDAEKKAKIAAIKAADIAKRVKAKATAYTSGVLLPSLQAARGYVPKPMISLRLVIVGMVGIGAVALYFMRRKKR